MEGTGMSESTTKTAHEAPGLVLAAGLVLIALGVPAVLTVGDTWFLALALGVGLCAVAVLTRSSVEARVLRLLLVLLGIGALVCGVVDLLG
jgi:hypothetical protein